MANHVCCFAIIAGDVSTSQLGARLVTGLISDTDSKIHVYPDPGLLKSCVFIDQCFGRRWLNFDGMIIVSFDGNWS